MRETAPKLPDQLLQRPEADRLVAAELQWGSVSEAKQQEVMDDVTSNPEFQAELERRLKEIDEHPERLLDGEQVIAGLRERAARKQAR